MLLEIPLSREEILSRQIYLWLREAILLGKIRSEERLPATRVLAEQLGVSRTVIVEAYDQLLSEGFIEGRHGSGTYVSCEVTRAKPAEQKSSASLRLSHFGDAAVEAMPRVNLSRKRPAPLRYDFSYTRGMSQEFPLEAWRRILLRCVRKAPIQAFDYGPTAGNLALREAIASHLHRSRAVSCDASQVIIVNGSQQALDLVVRVLVERNSRVAIENPHYQGAREIFRAVGARLQPVPVDRDGIDPAQLPRSARMVFVTPSHQFPTGAVLPLARRIALLAWAQSANAVIVEDDYDGEFRYEGQPVESLQGLDREGRVVYVGTFSRTIFPALRIGYLIAPKSLVPALITAKWLCDRHTPSLEQETLAEFIATGAYERHLRRARRASAQRRAALLHALHEYVGDQAEITGDRSGTHLILWPRKQELEDTFISRAAALGVRIYGVSQYYLGEPPRLGLILGYSRLNPDEIGKGIRLLAKALVT